MSELRTLTLREPKSGGQVEGVVSITGVHPYTEVFGSLDEAIEFGRRWGLEVIQPEDADDVPQVPPPSNSGGQP